MGDPIDRMERGEIEVPLRTDCVDVVGAAHQPSQDQHKSNWPVGWPRRQHHQGLKQNSAEANQRRRHESTDASDRFGYDKVVPSVTTTNISPMS